MVVVTLSHWLILQLSLLSPFLPPSPVSRNVFYPPQLNYQKRNFPQSLALWGLSSKQSGHKELREAIKKEINHKKKKVMSPPSQYPEEEKTKKNPQNKANQITKTNKYRLQTLIANHESVVPLHSRSLVTQGPHSHSHNFGLLYSVFISLSPYMCSIPSASSVDVP